ncbi:MAG: hypothetical protein MUE44_16055 [Oscillatoriaceae cyanobacterium Prado104]|jgi:hypothetical protein|nr:hypothetical protein [Oscillatoriaceae cyanobacterium Prado104]
MSDINLSSTNRNIHVLNNKTVFLTKNTVRFSENVYFVHNIESFSAVNGIDYRTEISYTIIIFLFILGLFVSSINSPTLGLLMYTLALGGTVFNLCKKKIKGLLMTFNSGNKILFVTNDNIGTKNAISVIYDFYENEKQDLTIKMNISESVIEIKLVDKNRDYYEQNIFYLPRE